MFVPIVNWCMVFVFLEDETHLFRNIKHIIYNIFNKIKKIVYKIRII